MNKVLLTLETLLLRQDKLVNNGYFLANIGEKIADRLPKFVEIAGGFLAITLRKMHLRHCHSNSHKMGNDITYIGSNNC